MRKRPAILPTLALIITFAFIGWLFSLHGTSGLLHVEFLFGIGVIVLAIGAVLPIVLSLARRFAGTRQESRPRFRVLIPVISSFSIIISLGGFGYVSGFSLPQSTDPAPRLIVMAGTGTNGIPDLAVVATSAEAEQYTITWGRQGSQSVTTEAQLSKEHVFILRDLEPAMEYRYRLNSGQEFHFSTSGVGTAPLRFAVGSDAHFGAGDSRNDLTIQMLAQIADPTNHFDYFFSLGDNVEFGFRPEQWTAARAAFSQTVSVIPSTFVAGNHDAMFTGLQRYLAYGYPKSAELENGTRMWHRFDVGQVHFIVLDLEWSAETFTEEQATWLETELKSIPPDDWTIVMNHGFYYGSGSVVRGWKWYDNEETIRRVTPLFEKYGVDLVFSGHAHQMELLQKSGVTYVIDGAFGGSPDKDRSYISHASLWYAAGQYGYADVTVGSTTTITFRNADGVELKSSTVEKLK